MNLCDQVDTHFLLEHVSEQWTCVISYNMSSICCEHMCLLEHIVSTRYTFVTFLDVLHQPHIFLLVEVLSPYQSYVRDELMNGHQTLSSYYHLYVMAKVSSSSLVLNSCFN